MTVKEFIREHYAFEEAWSIIEHMKERSYGIMPAKTADNMSTKLYEVQKELEHIEKLYERIGANYFTDEELFIELEMMDKEQG